MSLAILHPFMSFAPALMALAKPAPSLGETCPTAVEGRRRRGLSLFHRLAAEDFVARDVAFPLFLNPSRR